MSSICLSAFETQLDQSTTLDQLDKVLVIYLNSWKISGYTFSYYARIQDKKQKLRHELVSPRMSTWHSYYHEENFSHIDQSGYEIKKSLTPAIWYTQQQLREAKTEKDRLIREQSIEFGVTMGLSIPVHGPTGDYAELTLRQFREENCLEAWQEHKYAWQLAALYYYQALRNHFLLHSPNKFKTQLTQREQACLNLLMQHSSPNEIAKSLSISARTVNFHIQNINHKLGARNKYEAIAKAKLLSE